MIVDIYISNCLPDVHAKAGTHGGWKRKPTTRSWRETLQHTYSEPQIGQTWIERVKVILREAREKKAQAEQDLAYWQREVEILEKELLDIRS